MELLSAISIPGIQKSYDVSLKSEFCRCSKKKALGSLRFDNVLGGHFRNRRVGKTIG